MSARVAVSIGIKKSGKLPELPGALKGAQDFGDWAKAQGYDVHLVTDERGQPVTLQQLKTLIKDIVKAGEAERLLIYFAGHGTQPTFNAPFWLLSGWEEDSDEAVNVNLSFANAKRSGIAQIAIFADACRSNVTGGSTIGGGTIFPKTPASAGGHTEWDHFYSTRLGEEAQEVGAANPTLAYGIFTNCALQALKGELPQAVESRQGQPPVQVVTSQSLTRFLREAVPLESGRTPGAAVQFPDINPGWLQPNDIYFQLAPPSALESALESVTGVAKSIGAVLTGGLVITTVEEAAPDPARRAVTQARARKDEAVAALESTIAAAQGRESFETRQGLSIVGAKVVDARVRHNQQVDLFEESGAFHVRGYHDAPQTALVRLDNGNWIGTAIIPEFVGTIVVEDSVAVSARYLPARTSSRYSRSEFEPETPVLARWSALMSQGRAADAKELERAADKLRKGKHSDPSLGIFATYAYERAGRIADIDSIARSFAHANEPVPYDVAMLSTYSMVAYPDRLTIEPANAPKTVVAGAFPLMTEGWTFLDPEDPIVPRELFALRRGLLRSLWTTLRPAEGAALADLLYKGVL